MSTTNEDVVATAAELACTLCRASVPWPPDTQWMPLWDQGWRWLGTLNLYSCPSCPPMVTVGAEGRQSLGPGTEAAAPRG